MSRKTQIANSLETARRCAQIADEFRGRDIVVLDLRQLTPIVDFFVIVTGTSRRQMHALAVEVNRVLKAEGQQRLGIEGDGSEIWVLEDYGDVVLHLFNEDSRSLYDLENLWADAERIDWQSQVPPNPQSAIRNPQS